MYRGIFYLFLRRYKSIIGLYYLTETLFNLPLLEWTDKNKIFLFSEIKRYTLVPYKRLNNLYKLSTLIENNFVPGAFVECGAWKGGCAAIMAYISDRNHSNRNIWLFDSFEGLPEPRAADGRIAHIDAKGNVSGKLRPINKDVASVNDVKEIFFDRLKIRPNNVKIIKGWFQNTLPNIHHKIGPIAILRLDADWYESTKVCLKYLYDKVIPGGFIIIDDYGKWPGCRKAIKEFFKARRLTEPLYKVDSSERYFIKPLE